MDGINPDIWIQNILSLKNALFVSTLSVVVAIILAFMPMWEDWSEATAVACLFSICIVCTLPLLFFLEEAHACSREYSITNSIRYLHDYADRMYDGDYSKIDELDLKALDCRMGSRCRIDKGRTRWGLEYSLELLLRDYDPSMAMVFHRGAEEHVL